MNQLPKFTPTWNSTCFGQFVCPSSGVYSLYTQQWYVYVIQLSSRTRVELQFHPGPARKLYDIPLLSVQWINSWWWAEELPEACRFSCRSNFGELVHLVGFIIKNIFTMQRGHMNVKKSQCIFIKGTNRSKLLREIALFFVRIAWSMNTVYLKTPTKLWTVKQPVRRDTKFYTTC
jgi:hypothetical protein